jgi:hypothetical protein
MHIYDFNFPIFQFFVLIYAFNIHFKAVGASAAAPCRHETVPWDRMARKAAPAPKRKKRGRLLSGAPSRDPEERADAQ